MPFIETILGHINDSLKTKVFGDKRFVAKYCGVSTILTRMKGERLEMIPAIVDVDGEYKTVEPDDRYNLIIYHKTISSAYSAVKKSYGDEYDYKCTSEMATVVFADSRKVKLTSEQLEPMIIYGMPQRLATEVRDAVALTSCLITPLASDMDKVRVFRSEYPQSEYFLKPYHIFFLIRYRIETTFGKDCIGACLCGES